MNVSPLGVLDPISFRNYAAKIVYTVKADDFFFINNTIVFAIALIIFVKINSKIFMFL